MTPQGKWISRATLKKEAKCTTTPAQPTRARTRAHPHLHLELDAKVIQNVQLLRKAGTAK